MSLFEPLPATDDGPSPLELALDLDDEGIRLWRQQGSSVWMASWTDISALGTVEDGRLPDGRRGLLVALTTTDGESRVIAVPCRRPGAAGSRIRAAARRRGVDPDRPDRRVPLPIALGAVAGVGALVTWLLLLAGHVVAR